MTRLAIDFPAKAPARRTTGNFMRGFVMGPLSILIYGLIPKRMRSSYDQLDLKEWNSLMRDGRTFRVGDEFMFPPSEVKLNE